MALIAKSSSIVFALGCARDLHWQWKMDWIVSFMGQNYNIRERPCKSFLSVLLRTLVLLCSKMPLLSKTSYSDNFKNTKNPYEDTGVWKIYLIELAFLIYCFERRSARFPFMVLGGASYFILFNMSETTQKANIMKVLKLYLYVIFWQTSYRLFPFHLF